MRRGLGHPSQPERQPRRNTPAGERSAARGGDGDGAALTVSQLTRRIKTLLEGTLGPVSVEGEISGLKASPSGHVYFSLKDSAALADCVMWRSTAARYPDLPRDGTKVTVRGKLTVYEPRGRYQLVVSSLSAGGGKGDLWRRFEEIKERLASEGLFDAERKRPIPAQPRTVGIVTSPSGAALRDIITILRRRAPSVRLVVSPCTVQGREAASSIAGALGRLIGWGKADVIIIGRGGGSLEDLWPFNEEETARAIAASPVPVVSAVGHETDFTIADFTADARAATPSEAAERIAPDHSHLRGRIAHTAMILSRALAGAVRERRECLRGLGRTPAFRKPQDMFMPKWQQLDDTVSRYRSAMDALLRRAEGRMDMARVRLTGLSPLQVLERGYAVVLDGNGRAVMDASALTPGDPVTAVLRRGRIEAAVTKAEPQKEAAGSG